MKRYTEEHEWVDFQNGVATIGITQHAAKELGDITFVELPALGEAVTQGEPAATVESVKAAAEVYSPVGGTVSEVNADAVATPELVNSAPEIGGWLYKLTKVNASDLDALMSEDEYEEYLAK